MRGLIILCTLTLAVAAPSQVLHHRQHKVRSATGDHHLAGAAQEYQGLQRQQQLTGELSSRFTSPGAYIPVSEEQSALPYNYDNFPPNQQAIQNGIITKQFFIHAAPEEEADEIQEKILTIGQPRKNYNVVFIRAPFKAQGRTTVKIIPSVNEDKTVIYVLSKKSEAQEVDAQVLEHPATTTKPEVFFIKYRTPEEAQHAQEKIKAEYEQLGGSTLVSNEGISPISSVVGSLDGNRGEGAEFGRQLGGVAGEELLAASGNNGYLPPNKH